MSRQTTEARAAQRAAESRWAAHCRSCIPCTRARQDRKPAGRCADGQDLAAAVAAARRETERNRQLDARQIPGQAALFTTEEITGGGARCIAGRLTG